MACESEDQIVYINGSCPHELTAFLFSLHHTSTRSLKPSKTTIQTQKSNKQHNQTINMDTAKKAADYVTETVKGATSETSKETNKNVAKDSDNPITTR